VYGSADTDDRLSDIECVSLRQVDHEDGSTWFEGEVPLERTGGFGYTVRVLPRHAGLATPTELGVVAVA
jgi:starch phosphorylase